MQEHIQLCLDQIKDGTINHSQEYDLAAAYAYLGEKEKAYERLEQVPYWAFVYRFMKRDPLFADIRQEDRFQRIVAEHEEQIRRFRNALKSMEVDGQMVFSVED